VRTGLEHERSVTDGRRRALGYGLCLVGAAIIVFAATWVRWTPPQRAGDLRPRPDALEYEAGARNLISGRGYCLVVEGRKYPPRYPPGMSMLLAPFLLAWDGGPGSGIVAVLVMAVAGVIASMLATGIAAGVLAGLASGALLAASPAHVRLSRAVMSEAPSACLVAVVLLLVVMELRGAARLARLRPVLLGLTIAVATIVRLPNVLILAPAIVVLSIFGAQVRRSAVVVATCAAGLVPLLLYDALRFGNAFRTGYAMWVQVPQMQLRYVVTPPGGGGSVPNLAFYAANLGGFGELYPWPWTIAIVVGAACVFRSGERIERAVAVIAVGFLVLLLATYLPYFWQDARFFVPALPPLFVLAALTLSRRRRILTRGLGGVLIVGGFVALYRSPELYQPDQFFDEPGVLRDVAAATEDNAALFVRTNEYFFSQLVKRRTARLWVPLGLDEHMAAVHALHLRPIDPETPKADWIEEGLATEFTPGRAEATIHRLLATGRPVYLSALFGWQVPFFGQLSDVVRTRFTVREIAAGTYAISERERTD